MNQLYGMDWNKFAEVAMCLEASDWNYAKTMQWCPHWYTLKDDYKFEDRLPWLELVSFMRSHAYQEMFFSKVKDRLAVNEYKYWTMDPKLEDVVIINRTHLSDTVGKTKKWSHEFDLIAPVYDEIWSGAEAEAENRDVFALINWKGESVLDIGCGTGLFREYHSPAIYEGVDPSVMMLQNFKAKFPHARVIHSSFEDYFKAGQYDLVVSLFGSASYVDPVALQRIPSFLRSGGRFFLMFYAPGYHPVTDEKSGRAVPFHDFDPMDWPHFRIEKYGNYMVVRND